MLIPIKSSATVKGNGRAPATENVADILERECDVVIHEWLSRVEKLPELTRISMTYEDRTGYLPQLLKEVIARLRLPVEANPPISETAGVHGEVRRKQGYTAAMAVEESRLLQVSIFTILHQNVNSLDVIALLPDIVIIADEVDAQLKQQMLQFMAANASKAAIRI